MIRATTPEHLLDRAPEEVPHTLAAWVREREQPEYRAEQIHEHIYSGHRLDPRTMANLPWALREDLTRTLLPELLATDAIQVSTDGTRKFRFRLHDGVRIESVWIPSGARSTLCVSSQAGCPARCSFCATGAGGFTRDLSTAEILGQWLVVHEQLVRDGLGPITQMVFMGMGEPLLNVGAVHGSLTHLTSQQGFRFSPRRITVSTVGIPDRMVELCRKYPQVRLALSLHSAVAATRDRIVPVNRRHSLERLRAALMEIGGETLGKIGKNARRNHRRVSLEYVLLRDVNDSPREASALARFATGAAGHINLLPFHPFPGAPHAAVPRAGMLEFQGRVQREFPGPVTLRKSRGLDIAGACGQLALLDGKTVPETPASQNPSG